MEFIAEMNRRKLAATVPVSIRMDIERRLGVGHAANVEILRVADVRAAQVEEMRLEAASAPPSDDPFDWISPEAIEIPICF